MNNPGAHVISEINSQPEMWLRAAQVAAEQVDMLPAPGERVAVVGCGTSWFMAQAYAVLREEAGQGETDAFAASEFPTGRRYDRIVAITRSGTTTEVVELLESTSTRTLAIVGDPETPAPQVATQTILLPFADEKSVVQTRFATSTLALLRAGLGEDLTTAVADARIALATELPAGALDKVQFTFLGHGWTVGLANEAALKMREAALAWAESYPAWDYRHGPISLAEPHSLVSMLGEAPDGLAEQIRATGADYEALTGDPMAALIILQRLAVELSLHRGMNPDTPRNLTRSVILDPVS